MRTALSTLLLLAFSLPILMPPFISAANRSELPACCRAHGAHHCMMSGVSVAVPSRYRTIAARCPYFPALRILLMTPHGVITPAANGICQALQLSEIVRETEAGYRISADRTRQKRGPPAPVLL